MGIDDLVGNEGKIIPQYSYFKVISSTVPKAFSDMDAAIEYAVGTNSLLNYLKEATLYKTQDGRLCKGERFLYIIPNLSLKNVSYQIIGEDVGDEEPNFICFSRDKLPKGIKSLEEYIKETDKLYDSRSNVGLYNVVVTANDDKKTISVYYELLLEIKKNKTR